MKVTYQIAGLAELEKALKKLPAELVGKNGGPVRTALMAASLPVLRTAQSTIPDRDNVPNTGLLASMIRRRRTKNSGTKGREAIQVYIRGNKQQMKDAYYAPWLEFGAKGLAPTRWFTKSLESNVENSTNIFRSKLAGSIESIAKKIGNENARAVAAQVKNL